MSWNQQTEIEKLIYGIEKLDNSPSTAEGGTLVDSGYINRLDIARKNDNNQQLSSNIRNVIGGKNDIRID